VILPADWRGIGFCCGVYAGFLAYAPRYAFFLRRSMTFIARAITSAEGNRPPVSIPASLAIAQRWRVDDPSFALACFDIARRVGSTWPAGHCAFSRALSDRIGRKPMMLIPGFLLLVSIVLAFYVIARYRTTATLLGATAVLSSLAALSICPIVILADRISAGGNSFRQRRRSLRRSDCRVRRCDPTRCYVAH
jgi:hypothetical protein